MYFPAWPSKKCSPGASCVVLDEGMEMEPGFPKGTPPLCNEMAKPTPL